MPVYPGAMAERHTRVICHIGEKRYALDFWSRASEVNPVDAEVLTFPPGAPHTSKKARQAGAKRAKGQVSANS